MQSTDGTRGNARVSRVHVVLRLGRSLSGLKLRARAACGVWQGPETKVPQAIRFEPCSLSLGPPNAGTPDRSTRSRFLRLGPMPLGDPAGSLALGGELAAPLDPCGCQ